MYGEFKSMVLHQEQPQEEATELEWLRWLNANARFGKDDAEYRLMLMSVFEMETGKSVPFPYSQMEQE